MPFKPIKRHFMIARRHISLSQYVGSLLHINFLAEIEISEAITHGKRTNIPLPDFEIFWLSIPIFHGIGVEF